MKIRDQSFKVASGLIDINRIRHKANQANQESGCRDNSDICHQLYFNLHSMTIKVVDVDIRK